MTATKIPFLVGVLLFPLAPAVAQTNTAGAIRVESKEVLVPVVVLDEQRVEQFKHMSRSVFWHQFNTGDFNLFGSLTVQGLSASDFNVLQDGEEKKIESFTPDEQKQSPILTDNLGKYREFVGIGGGTWAIPLWEIYPGDSAVLEPSLSGYQIGYTPSSSPDGSCHKIQITVDRPNVVVFARTEFCNASHKGADPLQGSILGERIESDLKSNRPGKLTFDLAAIPLLAGNGTAPVRIVLEYASYLVPGSCSSAPEGIGITGTVLGEGGREILHFSDEAARTGGDGDPIMDRIVRQVLGTFHNGRCPYFAPFRYETQIEMAPGEYRLQVGLIDGEKFGRAELPLTVPSYRREQLNMSGIALARRFRDLQTQPPESPSMVAPRDFSEVPTKPTQSPIALPQNYAPLMSDGAEVTPTANTRFEKNDPFCYFFQIYEPPTSQPQHPRVEAYLRIVDATTGRIVRQVKPIDAASYAQPGKPLIPISGRLDISNFPTGAYELQAQATDSTGASTDWRSVTFAVK
jgi:hypothetical protein